MAKQLSSIHLKCEVVGDPRVHRCTHIHTHTHTCTHTHKHTHTHALTHTHPRTHTHTHIQCTHTCTHTHTHQLSSHLAEGSYLNPAFQPFEDISSLELPHSCSNGNEDQLEATQIRAPHKWLCDETLLCLLDPRHEENITAFQERWKRGEPVLITDVHHQLNRDLWTPESFERDFGKQMSEKEFKS